MVYAYPSVYKTMMYVVLVHLARASPYACCRHGTGRVVWAQLAPVYCSSEVLEEKAILNVYAWPSGG